jgi:hypothetical protein
VPVLTPGLIWVILGVVVGKIEAMGGQLHRVADTVSPELL